MHLRLTLLGPANGDGDMIRCLRFLDPQPHDREPQEDSFDEESGSPLAEIEDDTSLEPLPENEQTP